jgi:hypothetical protein
MTNKTVYTKLFLKELGKPYSDIETEIHLPLWWQNTRDKEKGGLRLTEDGINIVKEIGLETYEIAYPPDFVLTTQVVIFLDKFIDCPYFLSKKSITVTNEKKAVELALFSGDVRRYGIIKAMTASKKNQKID